MLRRAGAGSRGRLRVVAVLGLVGVVGGAFVASALDGDGVRAATAASPTARAEPRDLQTTQSVTGTIERSATTTIVHSAAGASTGTSGSTGTSTPPSATTGASATSEASISISTALATGTSLSTSLATTDSGDTATATAKAESSAARTGAARSDPCETTTTTSASTTSSTAATTTTTTTPCATTSSTTDTTTTTTTSTTTSPPPASTTTTTPPSSAPAPTTTTSAPTGDLPAAPGGSSPGAVAGGSAGGLASQGSSDTSSESTGATLTELVAVGATADRGTVLYRADEEPVAVVLAPEPLYRELSRDSDEGTDVMYLELNLVALRYGAGLTVDNTFDGETAAAVEDWETDLGRADPDGVVSVGEVVVLDQPATVLSHDTEVGDELRVGSAVLTVGSESQIVVASVDAGERADWAVGSTAALAVSEAGIGAGVVIEVGRDESGGEVELVVAMEQSETEYPAGTDVEVTRVVESRSKALAVPVAAVFESADAPAVRLAGSGEAVPVSLGLVADGWAEITAGLDDGAEVELPG